ncbi:ATP-binding cassette domain-containing protein [Flavobacterium oreochromis]|uniref:ATP-binding cassette domain-containing protein n=1 Tax=Flavobacterium oreochromis TaxID=2906078 RepID=UPI000CDAB3D1|nr:ATP-binding cassette domain-containing protein [Flavobacterium oreochromis]POR22253.1 hypothetical protein BWK58_11260 [Flavobacterium columnare]QYS87742.1 ATP-binding cassette domain-containing protein [Flavobacterium oreochromis]
MEYKLEIDSVNKSFGGKKVLSDIYLKCEIGEIVGIFGRNGSGKSTLLKILFGTLKAENSFIRLNNKVLTQSFKMENGISYLPQNNFIPNNFSVIKTVNLTIEENRVDEFWEDNIIQKLKNSSVGELSVGELKYLQIKLILFNKSKFCLLDEPYSGISPAIATEINKQIKEQSKNKGLIITDHNYSHLLEITTKIYLINKGCGRYLENETELVKFGYLNEGMLKK